MLKKILLLTLIIPVSALATPKEHCPPANLIKVTKLHYSLRSYQLVADYQNQHFSSDFFTYSHRQLPIKPINLLPTSTCDHINNRFNCIYAGFNQGSFTNVVLKNR